MRRIGLFFVIFSGMIVCNGCFYMIKAGSRAECNIADTANHDYKKNVAMWVNQCFRKDIAHELEALPITFCSFIFDVKEDQMTWNLHYIPRSNDVRIGGSYNKDNDAFTFDIVEILDPKVITHECLHRIWAKNMSLQEQCSFLSAVADHEEKFPDLRKMYNTIEMDADYVGNEYTELFAQIGAIIVENRFGYHPANPTIPKKVKDHYKKWIKRKLLKPL